MIQIHAPSDRRANDGRVISTRQSGMVHDGKLSAVVGLWDGAKQ
jgi:hypothetical protein